MLTVLAVLGPVEPSGMTIGVVVTTGGALVEAGAGASWAKAPPEISNKEAMQAAARGGVAVKAGKLLMSAPSVEPGRFVGAMLPLKQHPATPSESTHRAVPACNREPPWTTPHGFVVHVDGNQAPRAVSCRVPNQAKAMNTACMDTRSHR